MATKTKLTEGELFDPSTKTGWKLIPEQGWQYFDKGIVKTPGTTAKNTLKRVTGTIYEGGKTAVKYVDQFIEQDKKLRKKQRESKIQEYKDFGKAVSEFDVEKEIKEEGGRVLKNLGNAFADIPKKFLTEPLESVTGSGVFQDGKELTVKQYKDSMTRARVAATEKETLVEDIVKKKVEVSNTALYPDLLVGKEMNLVSNTENDISEFFNWRESIDPNSDTGKYLGDLSEHSTFKDNAALNILKTNGGIDTHTKLTWESLYGKKIKDQKPNVNVGEKSGPIKTGKFTGKTIAKEVSDVKYEDDVNPQDPDWKTEKQAWLDDTANSPAAKAGLDDELRWQAQQRHDKWKAERNQPETADQTPKDKIDIEAPPSATRVVEGGIIDPMKNLYE